jgi:N-methylhydantoinase A/oxoprolinase/acetone carboxylase beta subunit/N-methylhydantoinase B/oxoprolinase/acetone carboxylase alpha subunit
MCLGVDVGGTFTDAVLTEGSSVWRAKSPTRPGDVSGSVLGACDLVAERAGSALADLLPRVRRFGVGTTAVTNVLASRTGVRVGLITTAGFEDELPVAKGRRVNDGLWCVYPDPIVPRRRVAGVRERIDRDGRVLVPLDTDEAVEAARLLVDSEGVESLAVSFLWSFRNDRHEQQAVAAITEALPGIPVLSGAALQPTLREFERTAYAVLNAYTVAAVEGLEKLSDELIALGLQIPVLLVHSGGGTMTTGEARQAPIRLAASGPAAGVAASTSVAADAGRRDVVTCDMGGTSFDVAVISSGEVPRRSRCEVAGLLTSVSMVDVESIGAGGGSIAWVDARGMLRVGPESAGAAPGPACYGRDGGQPTITDALLVLGYLDPDRFLGGDMSLDVGAAVRACADLGAELGLDAEECAWGIRRIALDGMTTAVRSRLDVRGVASSAYDIVSFGGCGALFTPDIAASLGMRRVLIPELSSVLSAWGAATADIRRERARSISALLPGNVIALQKAADELRDEVLADLSAEGVAPDERSVSFEADLRFARQVWELTIPLAGSAVGEEAVAVLLERFREEYVRRYGAGSMMLGAPVELLTIRAVGVGATVRPEVASGRPRGVRKGTPATPLTTRRVRLDRKGSRRRVSVFSGDHLRAGHVITGPALVDERDTTVWLPAGATLVVERSGTLAIELGRGAAEPETGGGRRRAARAERAADPITLELLRSQLQSVAEEAAGAIERTAISPVVTESKDYSATLLDATGNLVAGGGVITYHWVAATRAVRATLERYGESIRPGDVFLANDPYNGGGLHPNDVFVQRPIFLDGRLVAWAALSAHLIDMGGMAMGSFAPAATDCFQEALRIPPVRLLCAGTELSDVWDIFRTNVRLDVLVEMDLRGLVAGSNVAHDKVVELARATGADAFAEGLRALQDLSERELRRRISNLAEGTYRSTEWVEWDDEIFEVPCTLTVAGDELTFDLTGAARQAPHFFNSKPYIIKSGFMMQAAWLLAPDLPYTEGLLSAVTLHCPEGSVVNSTPPAPVNAGHMHVAFAAAEVMSQCLRLAMWASPQSDRGCPVTGLGGYSALALSTWSGIGLGGQPDTWMMMDGAWVGSPAGDDRDGLDLGSTSVGFPQPAQFPDIEILESWYPILIGQRRARPGVNGAGRHRSGGGTLIDFSPHGTDSLVGQMLAMRAYVPLEGAAGGLPGATTALLHHRADGKVDRVSTAAAGVVLKTGERFEIRCASGGGVGDPLDRDVELTAGDVAEGRITVAEAAEVYGVVVRGDGAVDHRATRNRRASVLRRRLRRADPAPHPAESSPDVGPGLPLYPGIHHRGGVAYATQSGAALTVAPHHWTDGCPTLEESRPGPGAGFVQRNYLDPATGRYLYVEVVPAGAPSPFAVRPAHWAADNEVLARPEEPF